MAELIAGRAGANVTPERALAAFRRDYAGATALERHNLAKDFQTVDDAAGAPFAQLTTSAQVRALRAGLAKVQPADAGGLPVGWHVASALTVVSFYLFPDTKPFVPSFIGAAEVTA